MRDYERDYAEIVAFSAGFKGKMAVECINAYSRKRKIVAHRASRAFWDKVEEGEIKTHKDTAGYEIID